MANISAQNSSGGITSAHDRRPPNKLKNKLKINYISTDLYNNMMNGVYNENIPHCSNYRLIQTSY